MAVDERPYAACHGMSASGVFRIAADLKTVNSSLGSAVGGSFFWFSRTFDDGEPFADFKPPRIPGKEGVLCWLAALDHRDCGRTIFLARYANGVGPWHVEPVQGMGRWCEQVLGVDWLKRQRSTGSYSEASSQRRSHGEETCQGSGNPLLWPANAARRSLAR